MKYFDNQQSGGRAQGLAGAGHWLMETHADEVNAALLATAIVAAGRPEILAALEDFRAAHRQVVDIGFSHLPCF